MFFIQKALYSVVHLKTDIIRVSVLTTRFLSHKRSNTLKFQTFDYLVVCQESNSSKQGLGLPQGLVLRLKNISTCALTLKNRPPLPHPLIFPRRLYRRISHNSSFEQAEQWRVFNRAAQRPRLPSSCCFYHSCSFPQSFSNAEVLCVSYKEHTFNLSPTFIWKLSSTCLSIWMYGFLFIYLLNEINYFIQ